MKRRNPITPTGGGMFQMGNNDHQTAQFMGTVDPRWAVRLRGQNNEHRLFQGGEGTGRYSEKDWKALVESIEEEGFDPKLGGAFIIVEFGKNGKKTRDMDRKISDEMYRRYSREWGYPMDEAASLVDPDTDIIATIYEGNHRARVAYQLGIPLPLEMRFFGGSERFLDQASPNSPLGLVNRMLQQTQSNPRKKNMKRNAKLRLYKTGETDSRGRDVYRKVGNKPSYSQTKGILLGQYFVGDGFYDNVYKDEDGNWRTPRGILSGREQYLLDNNMPTGEMYSVDSPYKEGKGRYAVWYDGEPFAPIYDFEIVSSNPRRRNGRPHKVSAQERIEATAEYYPSIFGDFDGDGIFDVDDPDPYNRSKPSKMSIEEVQLSDEFRHLIELRNSMEDLKDEILEELVLLGGKKAYGRTKTPISTINKLRRKRLLGSKGLTDIIGTTVIAEDFSSLQQIKKAIQQGKIGTVIEHENFYATPLNGYRAHHFIIQKDGFPIEVQLKTIRMSQVAQASHTPYKQGKLNAEYMDFLTDLANKADKGGKRAGEEFARLMKKPAALQKQLTKNPRKRRNAGHSYVIMFKSVDGAGYIKDDNWKGHPQSMDRPKMTFSNKQSAIAYANKLQKKSDKTGNPYGYTYSVHTDNYPSRKVHQTKITNPRKRKNGRNLGYGTKNGAMLKNQLRTVARVAQELNNVVQRDDEVPDWVLSKATVAMDRLVVANNYIQSKLQGMTPNPRVNVNAAVKNARKVIKAIR